MGLPSFCRDVVTVWRAPLIEERGTFVRDWPSAVPHSVRRCSMQESPTGSTSWDTTEQGRTVKALLLAPGNADIESNDRIEFRGRKYLVEGAPARIPGATGQLDHLEINLVDWEG